MKEIYEVSDTGLPSIYHALQKLETSGIKEKVCILESLRFMLPTNSEIMNEFKNLRGIHIISKYLNEEDWKITANVIHILSCFMSHCADIQLQLTTEHIFKIIFKNLKMGSIKHKISFLLLVTSIVRGNVQGQIIVQDSGCFFLLIELIHDIVERTPSQEEDNFQYWYVLCTAIKVCIYNPQCYQNQLQVGLIIPKAVVFIDNWFHQAFNKNFTECLEKFVPLLVDIILDNHTNQFSFVVHSGLDTLLSGLDSLENWKDAPPFIESAKEKLIYLLDAVIRGNTVNCDKAVILGIIPLLLKMLKHFEDQAIRRAYTFHRKRTAKDLYLKWRNSFICSQRNLMETFLKV